MAAQDIVDLVSSDAEIELPSMPVAATTITKVIGKSTNVNSKAASFSDLSDDLDSTIPSWAPSPKRRKLSPTTGTKACARIESPTTVSVAHHRDEIIFTSSPKQNLRRKPHARTVSTRRDGSDDELPELDLVSRVSNGFSSTTAAILADISTNADKRRNAGKSKSKEKEKQSNEDIESQSDDLPVRSPEKKGDSVKKRQRLTSAEREIAAAEKDAAKAERAKLREAEKEKRKEERESKAQEKKRAADIAEVNRSKLDKSVTVLEMIVDLPSSIEGSSADNQTREYLRHARAEVTTYASSIPGIVKWRRKIRSDFDEEQGIRVPAAFRIDDEDIILCYLHGKEFCKLVSPLQSGDETLEMHLTRIKTTFPECEIIYLIEGLEKVIKDSKNASNQAYMAAVRRQAQQDQEEEQQQNKARKRKKDDYVVDENAIQDALLRLEVIHGCRKWLSLDPADSAQMITSYTHQISLKPYKPKAGDASFCMESGQVESGKDTEDTYLKILQQIIRIAPKEALTIAAEYPSVRSLVQGFERHGELAIENLMKVSDTGSGDRRIGPAASKMLHRIFVGTDPNISLA